MVPLARQGAPDGRSCERGWAQPAPAGERRPRWGSLLPGCCGRCLIELSRIALRRRWHRHARPSVPFGWNFIRPRGFCNQSRQRIANGTTILARRIQGRGARDAQTQARNAHERWRRKEGDEPQAGDRDRALGSTPARQESAGAAPVGRLVRGRGGAGFGQEAARFAQRRKLLSQPPSSAPVPVWGHCKIAHWRTGVEFMSNATGMSNAARDVVKDARKIAAAGAEEIRNDLDALRGDVRRLTTQIGDLLGAEGNSAWHQAKSSVEGVVSDAEAKGRNAVAAAREAGDQRGRRDRWIAQTPALYDVGSCARGRIAVRRHLAALD